MADYLLSRSSEQGNRARDTSPERCPQCECVSTTGRCDHGLKVPRPIEFVQEIRRREAAAEAQAAYHLVDEAMVVADQAMPQLVVQPRAQVMPQSVQPRAQVMPQSVAPMRQRSPLDLSMGRRMASRRARRLRSDGISLQDQLDAGPSSRYRDEDGKWRSYYTHQYVVVPSQVPYLPASYSPRWYSRPEESPPRLSPPLEFASRSQSPVPASVTPMHPGGEDWDNAGDYNNYIDIFADSPDRTVHSPDRPYHSPDRPYHSPDHPYHSPDHNFN